MEKETSFTSGASPYIPGFHRHPAHEVLPRLHDLMGRLGSDDQRKRLFAIAGIEGPSGSYKPAENSIYMAEVLGSVLEMISELKQENRQLREMISALTEPPKKKGD